MSCNCKNPDGTLAITCLGTCRAYDYAAFEELFMSHFTNVDTRLKSFTNYMESKLREEWKEGFIAGFDHCKDNY